MQAFNHYLVILRNRYRTLVFLLEHDLSILHQMSLDKLKKATGYNRYLQFSNIELEKSYINII